MWDPNLIGLWPYMRERQRGQSLLQVRTQQEDAHLQTRRRAESADTLFLAFRPPELRKINAYCLSPQSVVLSYCSLSRLLLLS